MSSLKLVIGNKNYSSWSLRPWFFLKNLGISFEEELVWLFEEDTEEKLKPYFSDSKVPLLIDSSVQLADGESLQVWDSLAIIEYIADVTKAGWPQDPVSKAIARSISAEMHSGFSDLRNALPMNCKKHFPDYPITNEVQQDVNRIVNAWEYCRNNSSITASSSLWLCGEFSGADAMFAPVVMRLIGYHVELSGFAKDYTQMVLETPSMQEWIQAGKEETHVIGEDEV